MKNYLVNFKKYTPLLYELVVRDIKIKYRRSVLGVLWTLLNPLMMMTVMSIVFSNLFRFSIANYPLYLLSGQVIFNFFSEATSSSMTAIVNNAPLIKKVYIPKYLFVLSRIISSIINIMAAFCALIIVMVVTRTELHYTIFLSIVPIALLILFATGIGMLLASLVTKFRDIIYLYSVLLTVIMYLMPVIYPMDMSMPRIVKLVVHFNPLTQILSMFRDVVMYNQLPSILSLSYATGIAIAVFLLGTYVFYKMQDSFILNI